MSTPELRNAAALCSLWSRRRDAELEAELRFRRLAMRLAAVGAIDEVVALAREASEEEAHHALVCARTAQSFGPTPDAEKPHLQEVGPAELDLRDRVLFETAAFCCVTETIDGALLEASLARATHPGVREALEVLLRDERDHSRLGWLHLAAERAAGRGAFLEAHLPAILDGTVHEELFAPLSLPEEEDSLARLGLLPGGTRLAVLRATLTEVVLPGFERAGVGSGPARQWLAARGA